MDSGETAEPAEKKEEPVLPMVQMDDGEGEDESQREASATRCLAQAQLLQAQATLTAAKKELVASSTPELTAAPNPFSSKTAALRRYAEVLQSASAPVLQNSGAVEDESTDGLPISAHEEKDSTTSTV